MQSVPKYGLIHRIHSLELVYFLQVQSVNMQGLLSERQAEPTVTVVTSYLSSSFS